MNTHVRRAARARVAVAVAIATALLAGTVQTASAEPPGDDPFYQQPLPSGGSPGDVVDSREADFVPIPVIGGGDGVNSWQVIYQSTDALGEPTPVSGTVLVPEDEWTGSGERPLISWAVGTRGLGDDCAPSYSLSGGGLDYEGLFIKSLLDAGWAVAVSDYQGLGTPGTHTYMVREAQGHAVLDMARAARGLDEAGISEDAPLGLMGYSQGGGATGAAAELASTYAPELDITAAAMGGVPADLTATAEFLDGSLAVAFAFFAAVGLDGAYPELDLESYLNDRGRALFETANDLCLVSVDAIATFIDTAFQNIDDYVDENPLEDPAWQARLDEQLLGDATIDFPVYQYHAAVDEIVPYGQGRQFRRDMCSNGTTVTWTPLPAEHALGLVEGFPLAQAYMAARFAGIPTAGTCWLP